MYVFRCLLFLIPLFFLKSALSAEPFYDTPLIKPLRQSILQTKNEFTINAISLVVKLPNVNHSLIIHEGTIEKGSRQTINDSNLFQIGSITKTYTAALIARAINQNQLKMSDPVGKFFPHYQKWESITIEQLINQTSGIPDYIQSKGWREALINTPHKEWSAHSLVDIAYTMPEKFKPGRGWAYSNTNYVLLGMIVSKAEGHSINVLMNNLLRKMRLNNSYFLAKNPSRPIMKRLTHGYYERYDQTQINVSWLQGAGAMISNARDLTTWMGYLFAKNNNIIGLPITSVPLVSTDNGKKSQTLTQIAYGWGLFRMNTPEGLIYFTPGLTPGYTSMMVYAPCVDVSFSYVASRGTMTGFHEKMIIRVLKWAKQNVPSEQIEAPDYCKRLGSSKALVFPKMG